MGGQVKKMHIYRFTTDFKHKNVIYYTKNSIYYTKNSIYYTKKR